jgi:hypothetical protein
MTRAYKSSLIYGKTPIHIPWITSMRGVNEAVENDISDD